MLKADLDFDFQSFAISIAFDLQKGKTLGLYGKSGIGKSTALRTLAGLHLPKGGHIQFDGDCWLDIRKKVFIKAQYRPTDLVFQDSALFPHMTVHQNLRFGQRITEDQFEYILSTLALHPILDKKATDISGGQKQRTAIARMLAYNPAVMLLDEPFSALDEEIKRATMELLKSWISEGDKMAVLASHDRSDLAFFTSDILEVNAQ